MTTKLLANQLKSLMTDPVEGFTVELVNESSLYEWKIYMEGPVSTPYEGGIFQLLLIFPKDYPMSPPSLRFISEFWHPNVYQKEGRVCISILHPPGEDQLSGELPQERWLPTQSVSTIILSVMSILSDPNCSSPANVDASVEWRSNREAYKKRCQKLVEKAKKQNGHIIIPHPDTNPEEHKKSVERIKQQEKGMDIDYFEMDDDYNYQEEDDDDEEEEDNNVTESDEEQEQQDDDDEEEEEEKQVEEDKSISKSIEKRVDSSNYNISIQTTSTTTTSSSPQPIDSNPILSSLSNQESNTTIQTINVETNNSSSTLTSTTSTTLTSDNHNNTVNNATNNNNTQITENNNNTRSRKKKSKKCIIM